MDKHKKLTKDVYLFDWGDTLMVDFPDVKGKMCDWDHVAAVCGAKETLANLSTQANVYIATGAADSTEDEIKLAFKRVGLSDYISGYFCKENIGLSKGSVQFLEKIVKQLGASTDKIAVVGDNFDKDIKPAIALGIDAYWFTNDENKLPHELIHVINKLTAIYE